MAYNNYFPTGYQYFAPQYGYQPQNSLNNEGFQNVQPNIQTQQNTAVNGLIWVSGESSAKAYPVAPNQTVVLWDSENQSVYLKSADATGMPRYYRDSYERNGDTSYARNGRSYRRRDSMGRYSREDGYSGAMEDMADQLRSLMKDAPDESLKKDIRRVLEKVESM